MAWFDILILGIIALSALVSLIRGFVREALSLGVWILAFWISWSFFRDLAPRLTPYVDTPSLRIGIAFVVLMLLSLVIGGMVNFLLVRLINAAGLSGTDRMIGALFGTARGVLLVSALVLLAGLTPFPQDGWWQQSHLVPYFQELALWMRDLLPADIASKFQYASVPGAHTLGVS